MTLRNRWRTKWFTREHLTILALLGLSYLSVNQYFAGRAKWVHSPLDVGDWLINYQGGFVRRGLVGQLFYWLTSSSHRDIGLLVMEFDALILLLLAATVSYLVVGSKNAWVS